MPVKDLVVSGPEPSPLRPGAFFLLMASVFAVATGYGIVLPALGPLLDRLHDGSTQSPLGWHAGMLTGIYMFALFAFAPLWGHVSDRIGRRPLILLGLAGYAFALVLFGLSESLPVAYVARALSGLFASAVLPVASAYVADTSAGNLRARRFAWMNTASLLGFLAGPALGGWMSGAEASPGSGALSASGLPFFAAAAVAALVWAGVYLRLPGPSEQHPTVSQILRAHRAGLQAVLMGLTLLVTFGLGSFEVGLALQGQQTLGLGPRDIALMFTECSLVMIGVQALIFSPLGGRLGGSPVVPLAFLAMAVALGLIPYATDLPILLLLVGVVSAASGILLPTLGYLVSLHATDSQGLELGKQTAAASLGQGLGSAASGLLFGIAMPAPFLLTAALALVGAGMGLVVRRRAVFQEG